MNSIGKKIKEYRQKNYMTQEQLASRLNITFQTVSKWETGVSSPDLSLIIPLTKIFHISADELLGICDGTNDQRYEELKQAYEHTFQTEDFAERQRICELAVSEYPGDMKWLSNLAWVVSNRSFEYADEEKYAAEQEKAIKLFDDVVKNCQDDILRGYAIQGITQLLGWRGRKNEAREYAEMLPEQTVITRDAILENVLEGDELILFKQKRIKGHLEAALWDLSLMPEVYTDMMQKLVDVMIPDGNYVEFNHRLYYAVRKKVNYLLRQEPNASAEQICPLLEQMKEYAAAYDRIVFSNPGVYKYTAPWFDHIEEDTREWLGNEGTPMICELGEYLDLAQFDHLRSHSRFQSLKG
ncbi:MAG: helix-turn-helix transcriptional regulator [Clostridia bacterium]|nr:helix-turn-helix transcriptional regulator [Clostridia bacterium]